jgi:predicted MPP superfamily phosphohydrolase
VRAHNPALRPALAERGVPLTLSGHTHYGQLAAPRLGWSVASLFLELAMGTYRAGESVHYINPGTNFWGDPLPHRRPAGGDGRHPPPGRAGPFRNLDRVRRWS